MFPDSCRDAARGTAPSVETKILDPGTPCSQRALATERTCVRSLARGDEYWRLERELVAAWREPPGDDTYENSLLSAAIRASSLKSFDYEVLMLIVLQLTNKPCDDTLLDFLNACFQLVEIEDDLKDYADDCAKNSFNLYRAVVRFYGPDNALAGMQSWLYHLEVDYLEKRDAASLSEETLRFHLARNEQQGGAGTAMAPESGAWNIPPPLAPLRRQENEHCCPCLLYTSPSPRDRG